MSDPTVISREEAIEIVARQRVQQLSAGERKKELGFLASEYGVGPGLKISYIEADDTELKLIAAAGLWEAFINPEARNPADEGYDDALTQWMGHDFKRWSHEALVLHVQNYGHKVSKVTGDYTAFACPCCGADSLPEADSWEICYICWWKDTGSDGIEEHRAKGSHEWHPLTEARVKFLQHGISRPERKDLAEIKQSIENYTRSRFFEIDFDNLKIFEKNTRWSAPIKPEWLEGG